MGASRERSRAPKLYFKGNLVNKRKLALGCNTQNQFVYSLKSFMERLIFGILSYDSASRTYFTGKIQTAFIYTMGLPQDMIDASGYHYIFENNKNYLQLLNGHSEYLISADSYQFDDYSKYAASNFDEQHKALIRKEQFPIECQKAFELGKKISSANFNSFRM